MTDPLSSGTRHRGRSHLRRVAVAGLVALFGCGKEDVRFVLEKKPIPELPYQGFRTDIPDDRRGNAIFSKAVFAREGDDLVTFGRGIRVWNASTGQLRRAFDASLEGNDALVVDGRSHTVLARRSDVAPSDSDALGLWFWDLRDGTRRGPIPEPSYAERAHPVGFLPTGEAVVIRGGAVEVWARDGRAPRLRLAAPPGRVFCESRDPIAHDKRCHELSHSGRWLATIDHDTVHRTAPSWLWLVDLAHGTMRRLTAPDGSALSGVQHAAFSPDDATLAVTVTDGMWIGVPVDSAAITAAGTTRFVAGDQRRNRLLVPMTFTSDGRSIVTMGDQYTVATYDAASGAMLGRVAPPFDEPEGAVRVSDDGSRVIAYRYRADILVVIDGRTGRQRGYLCPYFCNRAHNPVAVPYAVSPDGRRVATGGGLGAGLWDTDADTLIAPLRDPAMAPLRAR